MVTRDIFLKVDGLKITGQFFLPGKKVQAPYRTVCICHGVPSGRPPDPADGGYPVLAERICHEGFAVLIFNFRGSGASEGNFDMLGWTKDLKAAIDYLYALPEVDKSHLSLLGFSGGAAVSVCVAAQDNRISSVVACACPAEVTFFTQTGKALSVIEHFRNIGIIRDKDFPRSVSEWMDGFESVSPIKYVAKIAPRPLLLVHGNRDDVVDVSHAHKLYARAGEPKQIVIIEGAGHRLRQDDWAMKAAIDWLKSQSSN